MKVARFVLSPLRWLGKGILHLIVGTLLLGIIGGGDG